MEIHLRKKSWISSSKSKLSGISGGTCIWRSHGHLEASWPRKHGGTHACGQASLGFPRGDPDTPSRNPHEPILCSRFIVILLICLCARLCAMYILCFCCVSELISQTVRRAMRRVCVLFCCIAVQRRWIDLEEDDFWGRTQKGGRHKMMSWWDDQRRFSNLDKKKEMIFHRERV